MECNLCSLQFLCKVPGIEAGHSIHKLYVQFSFGGLPVVSEFHFLGLIDYWLPGLWQVQLLCALHLPSVAAASSWPSYAAGKITFFGLDGKSLQLLK